DFHFLKNVKAGMVFARPRIIRRGRKIAVVGVDIESEGGILLATSTFTYYTAE
ncbi:MAG: PaaI family thioesterase, partial [Oscillospiraceae bacterium]|nr:PaaI family thioesterase [Oscillospiraceae bacterium]